MTKATFKKNLIGDLPTVSDGWLVHDQHGGSMVVGMLIVPSCWRVPIVLEH